MHSVEVYGFGSFFSAAQAARDIDLLLIHAEITPQCCAFASQCRRALNELIDKAHITLLSKVEADQLNFVHLANAIYIGRISAASIGKDAELIGQIIAQ